MTRREYLLTNIVSAIFVVTVMIQFYIARDNVKLSAQASRDQTNVNNARQTEAILEQVAARIARGAETDTALRQLVQKYGIRGSTEAPARRKNP